MIIITIIGLAYLFYEGIQWIRYRMRVKAVIQTLIEMKLLPKDGYKSFKSYMIKNRYNPKGI